MAETITIPSPSVFLRASPDSAGPQAELRQQEPDHDHARPAVKKKNNNKKKKATVASSKSRVRGDAAVAKPKQSKSRNGCVTCKAKRLKCDESKPSCQQCKRRNVDCGGYKKDFKWKPFEETNVATNIAKQNKGEITSRPADERAPSALPLVRIAGDNSEKNSSASPTRASPAEEPAPPSLLPSQQDYDPPESAPNINATAPGTIDPRLIAQPNSTGDSQNDASPSKDTSPGTNANILERRSETHSPDHCDLDVAAGGLNLTSASNGPEAFELDLTLIEDFLQTMDTDEVMQERYAKDIEEISRMPPVTLDYDAWALRLASHPSFEDDANTPANGMDTLMFPERITYLYEQPYLSQTSPEMMMLRFDRLTCGILSIKDGPNENPWRTLIWPMAQTSPALYHAVCSMTAFHSSRDIPALRVAGHEHKSASVQNLLEGIEEGSMNLDTAIATTLALAFAETWDQHISSGNDHIQGARTMINIALNQHKQTALTGINLARLKFLCNAWVYLDVIARITTADEDESDDYDKLYCLYSEPQDSEPDPSGETGFGIDFGIPVDAQLDPLMGCASTLFPLIGRVANLVRRVYRSEANSPPMISQAMELKLLLETWDPPAFIEPPEDPTSDVLHSLQTAEAYRWATLLYLHQALPEIPGPSSAEIAKKVLVFLATVPLASRCVIIQIYPLMMAGCEAATNEDRQWVRERWSAMSQRMRIGIIEKCIEVTEEVWRRRDDYTMRPHRRSLISISELQIGGRPTAEKRGSSFDNISGARNDTFSWGDRMLGADGRRRTTAGDMNHMDAASISCRDSRDAVNGASDKALTVRGKLHWVGVMVDWGWEVLLG